MKKIVESDLYLPIKDYLMALGFDVKGEINNCDIVAKKEQELVIIELKLTLNITLLMQAVERLALTDKVYIAIPKQATIFKNKAKSLKKLIKRLGIGLIIVDMQDAQKYVEVVNDPKDYTPNKNRKKHRALLKEFETRKGDTQKGGSTRSTAGLTAYRQRSIRIALFLLNKQGVKGVDVKNAINEKQATQLLRDNHYGWFNKLERGIYQISDKGKQELPMWLEKVKKIGGDSCL